MFTMFIAATLLIVIHLYGTNSQEEGECSSESVEMRRATVDKELAALGCNNYTCGMEN